jgi:hypothetical protein
MNNRLAVLYVTHKWRAVDRYRIARLAGECAGHADCYLAIDDRTVVEDTHDPSASGATVHAFNVAALPRSLGYPYLTVDGIVPGCLHYMLIDFAKQREYGKYLIVENDVEFTGHWSTIMQLCLHNDFDLLAAHLYPQTDRPDWRWWQSLQRPPDGGIAVTTLKKAFLPIACLSRRAVLLIDAMHRSGWSGHSEVLIPTLLSAQGLAVRDFNDFGRFYDGVEQKPGAGSTPDALSTLRWRPQVTREEYAARFRRDLIFHPVKENWAVSGEQ